MHILTLVLLLITLCFNSLSAETMFDKMPLLRKKDYIVLNLYRSIAAIQVVRITSSSLEFQVALASLDILEKANCSSYAQWRQKNFPEAQLNTTVTIHSDMSFSGPEETKWLATLLTLPINKIPKQQRKKSGEPPKDTTIDLRPIWHPPIILNEKKNSFKTDAFLAKWPEDSSPLSGKTLHMYFPIEGKAIYAFPYWIESPDTCAHFEVIESSRE